MLKWATWMRRACQRGFRPRQSAIQFRLPSRRDDASSRRRTRRRRSSATPSTLAAAMRPRTSNNTSANDLSASADTLVAAMIMASDTCFPSFSA
jgi:hypothetical protein